MNEQLNLRQIWKNEALDFTPWLEKSHIVEDICHQLHLYQKPLEHWRSEVTIGDYRMDMIYKEKEGKGRLIVENQYEESDNKHLGQILVYSYLTHIKDVLWISEGVGREHQGISKVLQNIHLIPCKASIYQIENGYLFQIHVYDKYNQILTYVLDNDLKVLCRKLMEKGI